MIYVLIGIYGLALGSFVNALAWRSYKKYELLDMKMSPKKRSSELKKLSMSRGRSMCPHCEHALSAKDLVPVVSWLWLKGGCRYCKKSISPQYPLVELSFAALLVLSYAFWPLPLNDVLNSFIYVLWSFVLVCMAALAVIDFKHQILPTPLVHTFTALAAALTSASAYVVSDIHIVKDAAIGSLVLGILFWAIYVLSHEKWVGGGDVRLLIGIGLLLGWQGGLLSVVIASYIGTLVLIGLVLTGKYQRCMRIAFGPLLLAATYIVFLWGSDMIDAYKRFSGL